MATINAEYAEIVKKAWTKGVDFPVDVANTASAANEGEMADATIAGLSALQSAFSLFSQTAAKGAAPLLVVSGANNIVKAYRENDDQQYIQDSTLLDLASDATALIGIVVAGAAAAASAPVALTILAVSSIGGTLLSLTALAQEDGEREISDALNAALTDLADMINSVGDAFGDELSDKFFPESTTEDKTLEQYLRELPNGEEILESLENPEKPSIDPKVNEKFQDAIGASPRVDPMILDLDGDGVETTSAQTNGVLFDGDGDGIRTSTGWVSADDGLLVLDRNYNGEIDSGRELFGDSTLLSDGSVAEDGFEALSVLDSNFDGVINELDDRFFELSLWQDANADGVSQIAELKTLADFNVQ